MPHPTPQPSLSAGQIIRQAYATYRINVARVVGAAVVVLLPLNMLAALTATRVDTATDGFGAAVIGRILLAILAGLGAALSTVAFAGVLDQLVAESVHGKPRQSLPAVVRSLPYVRLFFASVLLAVVLGVGLALLVLPGLIGFTLCVLVGPLISQGAPVRQAFRQSVRLVRPHFWLVAGLVTVPMLLVSLFDDGLDASLGGVSPWLSVAVVNGLVAATVHAFVGLIEVLLTEHLLAAEPATAVDRERVGAS